MRLGWSDLLDGLLCTFLAVGVMFLIDFFFYLIWDESATGTTVSYLFP